MKFDITIEPWLPVKTLTGEAKTVNLLELLEEAHRLQGLEGLNPMEEYSVLRFFSVFLSAAYRPEIWEDKMELLDSGCFDMEKIRAYIEMCRREGVSFDIFDEKRPFMQATPNPKDDQEKNLKSPAVLDSTRASGNNHMHYDHTLEDDVVMTPAEAFRGILSAQIFCTAMSGGYPSNVYGAPPMFYLPKGSNLFEGLVLSMVTVTSEEPGASELWRNPSEIIPKEEVTSAPLLYGLFFPARRIRLVEDDGFVNRVYYQPGLHFTGFAGWTDPHAAYRPNKENVMVSVKPNLDREGWRNLGTLAARFAENGRGVPISLKDYSKILEEQGKTHMDVMIFGVVTNQASYYDVQRGTFTLDTRIANHKSKASAIAEAALWMDGVGSILRKRLKEMIASDKRGENDARNLVHRFYAQCEPIFYALSDKVAGCGEDDLKDVADGWRKDVKKLAQRIFSEAQEIYCSTADELIRAEKAYKWLNVDIAKLMKGR